MLLQVRNSVRSSPFYCIKRSLPRLCVLELRDTEYDPSDSLALVSGCEAGVICLYRYFVIFLLVLISFPTAKSFLQRIFTRKQILGPSGKKISYKSYLPDRVIYIYITPV